MKILFLTLKKAPFEVMATGEKNQEFRAPSKWVKSRLFDKNGCAKKYDAVKFVNGYGAKLPYFIAEYKEVYQINCDKTIKYSNNLIVYVKKGDYVIRLGNIIETGNLESE